MESGKNSQVPEVIFKGHFPCIIVWIGDRMSKSIHKIHSFHIEQTSRKIQWIKISFCIFIVLELLHFQNGWDFTDNILEATEIWYRDTKSQV